MKTFVLFIILLFFLDLVHDSSGQSNRPALTEEMMEKARIYLKELSDGRRSWAHPSDGGFFRLMPEEDPHDGVQIQDEQKHPTNEQNQPANFVQEEKPVTVNSLPDSEPISIVDDQSADEMWEESGASKHCAENIDCFFLARWLKRLKNEVDKISEMNLSKRKIVSFPLTEPQISTLKAILQNANHNLVDVEGVIKDILSQLEVSDEEGISLSAVQSSFFSNSKIMYASVVSLILAVLVYIFHFCEHPRICICFIVVVATVCAQWKLLYENAVAEKMAKLEEVNYPATCKKGDFGIFESMGFYFKSWFVSTDSCAAYYKAQMVDPFWEVSLMEAISLSVSRFLFAPLEALAHVLNKALKSLLLDLSLFERSFLLLLIIVVLLMVFSYKVRLPWFLAVIEPAPSRNVNQQLPSALSNTDDNQYRDCSEQYITMRETNLLKHNPPAGKAQIVLSVDSCCHCAPESCRRELTSDNVEAIDYKQKTEPQLKKSSITSKLEGEMSDLKKKGLFDEIPDMKEVSREDEIFVMRVKEILRSDRMCDSIKTLQNDEIPDAESILHDDDDKENIPGLNSASALENCDDSELKKVEKLMTKSVVVENAKFNERGDST